MMKNLMHRIKAPTVLLMLLFLFLGGVISVKANPKYFGWGESGTAGANSYYEIYYEGTTKVAKFTIISGDDLSAIPTDTDFSDVAYVKFVSNGTYPNGNSFYISQDVTRWGNLSKFPNASTFDFSEVARMESSGSITISHSKVETILFNPRGASSLGVVDLSGCSKLKYIDIEGAEFTSLALPDPNAGILINGVEYGDNRIKGGGYSVPEAKKGEFGLNRTDKSTYNLSIDGKTLTLTIKAAGDLASIDDLDDDPIIGAADWTEMRLAETVKIDMDGGSLNAADINKLMSSFPNATTINLANATISENVEFRGNTTVTSIDITGINAGSNNITIDGCTGLNNIDLTGATAGTIAIKNYSSLESVNVTGAEFSTLEFTDVNPTGTAVKVIGVKEEEKSNVYNINESSHITIYDGETFGDNGSKYRFKSDTDHSIVTITINEPGDLAKLKTLVNAEGSTLNFNDTRLVVLKSGGKSLNGEDFASLDIFGKNYTVDIDFTDTHVEDEARSHAKFNENGVVIISSQYNDPRQTATYYTASDDYSKLSAITNIAGDGKILEVYALNNHAVVNNFNIKYVLEVYKNLNEVRVQGAGFNDGTANEWLESLCSNIAEAKQITKLSLVDYTLQEKNNSETKVTLSNSNLTSIDFSYLWGTSTTSYMRSNYVKLDLTGLTNLNSADLSFTRLNKITLPASTKKLNITGANINGEVIVTGCTDLQIQGGQTYQGTLTPSTAGVINYNDGTTSYALLPYQAVPRIWEDPVNFGQHNNSTYEFAYEKTVVRLTINETGDLASIQNLDDKFTRARVVQIITKNGAKIDARGLANLHVFGKNGDVNIDFTNAEIDSDDSWASAKYSAPYNVMIFTPGARRPRTFYKEVLSKASAASGSNFNCVKAVANIHDDAGDGVRNAIEMYGVQDNTEAAQMPMTLYRRMVRLYDDSEAENYSATYNINTLIVHGEYWYNSGSGGVMENKADYAVWLQTLANQMTGIPEIETLKVYSYNFDKQDLKIDNPNLTHIDLSYALNANLIDLKGCRSLQTAVFNKTSFVPDNQSNAPAIDVTGLSNLTALNLTGVTGSPSLIITGNNASGITLYGCTNLSNHATLTHASPCAGDLALPYTLDAKTNLDITIDLNAGRQWDAFGDKPTTLRQFLRMIRKDLANQGNTYIDKADPTERLNYVKLIGALRPKNMGALNRFVYDGKDITAEATLGEQGTPMVTDEKYDYGDIACKFLDLSEAYPISNESVGYEKDAANTVKISWAQLFRKGTSAAKATPGARDASEEVEEEEAYYGEGVGLGVDTYCVDYVILPADTDPRDINKNTFEGFHKLKAAGYLKELEELATDNSGKHLWELNAYVKEAGTLRELNAYMDAKLKTKTTPAEWFKLTNGTETQTAPDSESDIAYRFYKYQLPNMVNLTKLTLCGTVKALDLCGAAVDLTENGHHPWYDVEDGAITTQTGALSNAGLSYLDLSHISLEINPKTDEPYHMDLSFGTETDEVKDNYDTVVPDYGDVTGFNVNLLPLQTLYLPGYKEGAKITNVTTLPAFFINNSATSLSNICIPYNITRLEPFCLYHTKLLYITATTADGTEVSHGDNTYTLHEAITYIGDRALAGQKDVHINDVYIMAKSAPLCDRGAFDVSMLYGENGFKGNNARPICRANYVNGDKYFTMLHFPSDCGITEAAKYTDITKKYSLLDEVGETNGLGKPYAWPTHIEFGTTYANANAGVLWKENDDDATTYYDRAYTGWHQFVLADYFNLEREDVNDDNQTRDFSRFKKNVWYSVCFPYNMTKSQLLKYFGAKYREDIEVTVNGTPITEDNYPEVRTLVQVLRQTEPTNKVIFMFSRDLVCGGEKGAALKVTLTDEGKKYNYGTAPYIVDCEETGVDDDPVVIEGGHPYIIRPCYPDDKLGADRIRPEEVSTGNVWAFEVKDKDDNVVLEKFGTSFNKSAVPYTDHWVHAIKAENDKAVKDDDGNYNYINTIDTGEPYKYYFTATYSEDKKIPQYSFFFGVPKSEFTTYIYRDMTPEGNERRPWTQFSAIIGGRASAKIKDNHVSGMITTKLFLDFQCDNDWFGADTSNARPYTFDFAFAEENGNTAAIENVTISEDGEIISNGSVYNLNGIRVNGNVKNLQKGIYIMNGRKFVVK